MSEGLGSSRTLSTALLTRHSGDRVLGRGTRHPRGCRLLLHPQLSERHSWGSRWPQGALEQGERKQAVVSLEFPFQPPLPASHRSSSGCQTPWGFSAMARGAVGWSRPLGLWSPRLHKTLHKTLGFCHFLISVWIWVPLGPGEPTRVTCVQVLCCTSQEQDREQWLLPAPLPLCPSAIRPSWKSREALAREQ